MNSSERIKTVLRGEIPDRIPICEVSFWPKTIERWKKEGLPENTDPIDYLGMDRIRFLYSKRGFYFEKKILGENEEQIIYIDEYGKKMIDWKPTSKNFGIPHVIQHSLSNKSDWERMEVYLKPEEKRIPDGFYQDYLEGRKNGDFIALTIEEPAWFILEQTFGFENGLPLFIQEKDLVLEIMEKVVNFNIEMCDLVLNKGIKPDCLWMWSDLCYKNGMLFSPKIFREIVMPFHKKIVEFCKDNDLFLILHCDGYVRELIPLLIEEGIDAIQPLEGRCGNDVREYKKLFGDKITLFGNISTEILSNDKEKIKKEIEEKVKVAKENGRYIFHSDHSIPNTVSFENYRYAIELAKETGSY
ncbi:MAG: hypothetical protein NC906_04825 [Candidatus Omnitrophica bacterium]|nr:hypothetical protein [Candidatus Omnitrophota bacterium]